MRKLAFGAAAATALLVIPISAFSQSIEVGPGGIRLGGQCDELRRACENKDRLGGQGEGNCRRYRETCQRPSRRGGGGGLRKDHLHNKQPGGKKGRKCTQASENLRSA